MAIALTGSNVVDYIAAEYGVALSNGVRSAYVARIQQVIDSNPADLPRAIANELIKLTLIRSVLIDAFDENASNSIDTLAELNTTRNTLIANINDLQNSAEPSQSFILTANADAFTGGAGDDSFNGVLANALALQTLNSGDNLDGGAGNDTLSASLTDASVAPTLSAIENLIIRAFNDATLSLANATGVTQITNQGTVGALLTLTNVATSTQVNLVNSSGGTTITYANVAGAADSATVSVSNATSPISANGIETLNLIATGPQSTVNLNNSNNISATRVNISGSGNLALVQAGGDNGSAIIDGSAATGNLTIANHAAAQVVTGGSGNDTIAGGAGDNLTGGGGDDLFTLTEAALPTMTIVGGAGAADTLGITATGSNTLTDTDFVTTRISGIESLRVTAAAASNGDADLTLAANANTIGINTVSFVDVAGGNNANLVDLSSAAYTQAATVNTGAGSDTVIFNIATGGGVRSNTANANPAVGEVIDVIQINGVTGTNQVRLSFVSGEVGNGSVNDSGAPTPPLDGGLAVRIQQQDVFGSLFGTVSRSDDEGVAFVTGVGGPRINVRDVVSGANRGLFEQAILGTNQADVLTVTSVQGGYINAGAGNDSLDGNTGNDFLVGGAGNDDILTNQGGNDSVLGGGGDDGMQGGAGNDSLDGGDGNDTIIGAGGNNTLIGGNGNDIIFAGSARDLIDAGDGDDFVAFTLVFGGVLTSIDTVNGGAGMLDELALAASVSAADVANVSNFEVLSFAMSQAVADITQDLLQLSVPNTLTHLRLRGDAVAGIDVSATSVSNTLNRLEILGNQNTVVFDRVTDNASNALLITTPVLAATAAADVNITVANLTLNDEETLTIDTGAAANGFTSNFQVTNATNAADLTTLIAVGAGDVDLFPGSGITGSLALASINASGLTGNFRVDALDSLVDITALGSITGTNTIWTGAGNDVVTGGNLDDLLQGFGGNDSLIGGAGNDILLGGNNLDTLVGGLGADQLNGEGGNDTFRFDGPNDSVVLNTNAAIQTMDMLTLSAGLDILDFGADVDVVEPGQIATGVAIATTGSALLAQLNTAFTANDDGVANREAMLINFSGGQRLLVLDVNGDQTITQADTVVQIVGGAGAQLTLQPGTGDVLIG